MIFCLPIILNCQVVHICTYDTHFRTLKFSKMIPIRTFTFRIWLSCLAFFITIFLPSKSVMSYKDDCLLISTISFPVFVYRSHLSRVPSLQLFLHRDLCSGHGHGRTRKLPSGESVKNYSLVIYSKSVTVTLSVWSEFGNFK